MQVKTALSIVEEEKNTYLDKLLNAEKQRQELEGTVYSSSRVDVTLGFSISTVKWLLTTYFLKWGYSAILKTSIPPPPLMCDHLRS